MAIKSTIDYGSRKKREQDLLKRFEQQALEAKKPSLKNTSLTNNAFNSGQSYEKILYDLQQEELAKKKSVDNQALVTKARDIYTKQYSESGTPEYKAEREATLIANWKARQAEANKGYFNTVSNKNAYGQPTNQLLDSAGDVVFNITKGLLSIPESATDLAQYGYSALFLKGDEKKQYDAKVGESWAGALIDPLIEKGITASVFGDKSDNVSQMIGYNVGMMALQGAGVPWQITAFAGGMSNAWGEAYSEGANTGQAFLFGLTNGLLEVGTEYISGGIKLPGTGKITSEIIDKATKTIKSRVTKFVVKYLANVAGEVVEEEMNNVGHALGRYLIYNNEDATLWDNLQDENWVDTAIASAFSTGIISAGTSIDSLASGRDINTGLTQNEEKVVQAEVGKRIADRQLSEKEITQIEKQVKEDLIGGEISIETIEETLGSNINFAKDRYIERTYNEKANASRNVRYLLDENAQPNVKAFYESAENSGINNTTKSRAFLNNVAKIIEKTGIKLEFTNNQELSDLGLDTEGKNISSVNIDGTVKINAKQSTKALEAIVGYEITNEIAKDEKLFNTLKDEVIKYAKLTNQYDSKVAEIKDLYVDYNLDIDKEITNRLIGEYLFAENNFISQLATNKKLFEKLQDNIQSLFNMVSGKEARQLEVIKNKLSEAYAKMDKNKVANENMESNSISQPIKINEQIGDLQNGESETIEELTTILTEHTTPINKSKRNIALAKINMIDKGYYIDILARETGNEKLSALYDYSLMAPVIAQQTIGVGRKDLKTGEKIGDALMELFKPAKQAGLELEFNTYMYEYLNTDRMTLVERYNEPNKAVIHKEHTAAMSENNIRDYELKYPQFKGWAEKIWAYEDANLKVLVEHGALSQEQVDGFKKKYPHYVPLHRLQAGEQISHDYKRINANTAIKRAVGGQGAIIALDEAMAAHTISVYQTALRNDLGNELYKTLDQTGEIIDTSPDDIISKLGDELIGAKDDKMAMFTIYRNGKKVRFNVDDNIYDALKPRETPWNFGDIKPLKAISNVRRGLLTEYNIGFMARNPFKDVFDMPMNSKFSALRTAKSLIEAAVQMKKNGKLFQIYVANGGDQISYFNQDEGFNIHKSKIESLKPLRMISDANRIIEMWPRFAEFISSIEEGLTIQEGMYNAAEVTTNFKRGGDATKYANRNGATFLNASVVGFHKQVKNIQDAKSKGWRGTLTYMAKLALLEAPSLLNAFMWKDDEDYQQLSEYVKNAYFIVGKYDDGKFIRIPKGRVMATIHIILNNAYGTLTGDVKMWEGFMDSMEGFVNNLAPNNPFKENVLSPIFQVYNNEAWYGGDLLPLRLSTEPVTEQFDETTDSVSKWLGNLTGTSPYKINYIIDQYSGIIGDLTLPYLTPKAEGDGSLLAPLTSQFTTDSVYKNQYTSDFYKLKDEIDEKAKMTNATDEQLLASKYLGSVNASMNNLYAQKRELQNADLPDKEKYNAVRDIQQKIVDLASFALDSYDYIDMSHSYAEVGGLSYYRNSSDEWTKLSGDAKIELDELKLTTQQKSSYFQARNTINQLDGETKKRDIGNIIINTSLPDKAKIALYDKTYNNKFNDVVLNTGIDIDAYLDYASQTFEADKDYKGNSISNTRRSKIISYVNSLDLSIPQKAMLIRKEYSTYKDYDDRIIEYVNSQNITYEQKEEILSQLGFTIVDGEIR